MHLRNIISPLCMFAIQSAKLCAGRNCTESDMIARLAVHCSILCCQLKPRLASIPYVGDGPTYATRTLKRQIQGGYPSGQGKRIYSAENATYEGDFVNVPHGQGTKTWHTRSGGGAVRVYTGGLVKGAKHGKGIMVFKTTGNRYIQNLCFLFFGQVYLFWIIFLFHDFFS